jgi:DNA (cytosine-5)-methyltransferase 1
MQDKSLSDVASRLKRACMFVDVESDIPTEEIIFNLNKNNEFKELSYTVQSQLRRSIKLYKAFLDST